MMNFMIYSWFIYFFYTLENKIVGPCNMIVSLLCPSCDALYNWNMKNDEKETLDLNLIIIAFDVVTYANFCLVVGE